MKKSSEKRSRSSSVRREDALRRLREKFDGEDEDFDPSEEPIITPLLKSADGGIPKIIEALRAHDDDDAREFISMYDSVSKEDRRLVTLEEIAYVAGIGSLRLGEIAQSAMILHGQLTTKLLLASNLHKVVARSLKEASTPKGIEDRKMMLTAGGILPSPKGTTIAIQNNNSSEGSKSKDIENSEAVYLDPGQRLRAIHEAVEQRRLPSPPSSPIRVGGTIDHMQLEAAEIVSERG